MYLRPTKIQAKKMSVLYTKVDGQLLNQTQIQIQWAVLIAYKYKVTYILFHLIFTTSHEIGPKLFTPETPKHVCSQAQRKVLTLGTNEMVTAGAEDLKMNELWVLLTISFQPPDEETPERVDSS